MKKLVCILSVITVISVAALIICCRFTVFLMKEERKVPFEFEAELTVYDPDMNPQEYDLWFPISDWEWREWLGDYCNIDSIDFDFDQYTYIATCGYSLEELTYNYWNMWGKFSKVKTFHGRVVLKDDCSREIVKIYRIEKMRISNDVHGLRGLAGSNRIGMIIGIVGIILR